MMRASEPGQASDGYRGTDGLAVGPACALLAVLLHASFTLVSRLGLRSVLGVADIAAIRFGTGGLLLSPVLLRHGLQPGHTAGPGARDIGRPGIRAALLCRLLAGTRFTRRRAGARLPAALHLRDPLVDPHRQVQPPHDRRCDADCGRRGRHDGRHAGAGIAEAGRHRAVRGRCPGPDGPGRGPADG